MPLSKETLGAALFAAVDEFNDTDIENIATARRDFWKAVAGAIIEHFQRDATLNVPGTGLATPNGAVTGISTTGKIL